MMLTMFNICRRTLSGNEFSVIFRSFENLFIIIPEGVTSKYVLTGAWHILLIIFSNSFTPTDRVNNICIIHDAKVISVIIIVAYITLERSDESFELFTDMSFIHFSI